MSKIPDKPQDIFIDLADDYKKVFGSDLVSLIIYGSAAAGFYVKGKSDINLLVVLTRNGINRLEDAMDTVKKWMKRRVSVPWVMTGAFINNSLDCYPIEFLNLKINHVLIHGEDVLTSLQFKPEDLRLQIEKELKGKLVLLRQGYLETEGKSKHIKELIGRSLMAFISIFNALIYLQKGSAPPRRRETVKELAGIYVIDDDVFLKCIDIKEGKDKFSGDEIVVLFKKYISEVEKIINIVDAL